MDRFELDNYSYSSCYCAASIFFGLLQSIYIQHLKFLQKLYPASKPATSKHIGTVSQSVQIPQLFRHQTFFFFYNISRYYYPFPERNTHVFPNHALSRSRPPCCRTYIRFCLSYRGGKARIHSRCSGEYQAYLYVETFCWITPYHIIL